ncbi:uncharacterized protein IWZ02DRAFT_58081 [Phyllosticta citriasiana]|uniref:uncharacterized protein n=1 Tax=Phyllosticta citriasiana TaxID=595635 RepID=UPI0030FDEA69
MGIEALTSSSLCALSLAGLRVMCRCFGPVLLLAFLFSARPYIHMLCKCGIDEADSLYYHPTAALPAPHRTPLATHAGTCHTATYLQLIPLPSLPAGTAAYSYLPREIRSTATVPAITTCTFGTSNTTGETASPSAPNRQVP